MSSNSVCNHKLVIKKIGLYDYRPNWTLVSPVTINNNLSFAWLTDPLPVCLSTDAPLPWGILVLNSSSRHFFGACLGSFPSVPISAPGSLRMPLGGVCTQANYRYAYKLHVANIYNYNVKATYTAIYSLHWFVFQVIKDFVLYKNIT